MSRRGAEAKPAWRAVPSAVKAHVERTLGARVARAERVYGGYAPSATFRMRLADGRRAFFKGINRDSNEVMRRALDAEERVYRELGEFTGRWGPRFLGSARWGDWHALLLEDLGPATIPPWSGAAARGVASEYAAFHAATLGRTFPDWLSRRQHAEFAEFWSDERTVAGAASLAAAPGEAQAWLEEHLRALRSKSERLAVAPEPFGLLHFDTRSDNIRFRDGHLWLVDWPWTSVGPVEFDLAAFAQSVEAEAGPAAETVVAEYERVLPVRSEVLDASLAAIAGYFANRAAQPPIPGLPRLRSVQRRQLKASLAWAARRFALSEASWLAAVPD